MALRAALALEGDAVAERLTVFGGVLSLLAAIAEEQPLLCVIDDAQWLDEASAAAMGFAARRLGAEGIAVLFAVRDPEIRTFAAPGIPELWLGGLNRGASRQLLATCVGADAAPHVAEQLIELSAGNPLALIELPSGLTASQLAGQGPLGEPMRARPAVERIFARRLAQLPGSTRRAVLVAAASDVSELRAFLARSQSWGSILRPSTKRSTPVSSPWARASSSATRSRVLRSTALLTTQPERGAPRTVGRGRRAGESDRQAWHLAATTHAPDEEIASALVRAAESARHRGGAWSEAKALERAARMTPNAEVRAQRLDSSREMPLSRRSTRARGFASRGRDESHLEFPDLAHAQARRAYIRIERGELDDALDLMIGGANDLERMDPRAAAVLLTNAATAADHHRLDLRWSLTLAERAWRLAGETGNRRSGAVSHRLFPAIVCRPRTRRHGIGLALRRPCRERRWPRRRRR